MTFCSVDQLTLKVFHSCVKVLNRSRIRRIDRKLKVLLQYFQVFSAVSDDLIDRFQKGILQNVLPDCPRIAGLSLVQVARTAPDDVLTSAIIPVQPLVDFLTLRAKNDLRKSVIGAERDWH